MPDVQSRYPTNAWNIALTSSPSPNIAAKWISSIKAMKRSGTPKRCTTKKESGAVVWARCVRCNDLTVITPGLHGHDERVLPTDLEDCTTDKMGQGMLAAADACGAEQFTLWGISSGVYPLEARSAASWPSNPSESPNSF